LVQAFLLIGCPLNDWLADPINELSRMNDRYLDDEQLIDELYWRTLSRAPQTQELQRALAFLGEPLPATLPDTTTNHTESNVSADANARADNPGTNTTPSAPLPTISREVRFLRIQDLAWALLNSKEFVFRH